MRTFNSVWGETQPKKVPFNNFVVRLMLNAITTKTTATIVVVVVATFAEKSNEMITHALAHSANGIISANRLILFYQQHLSLCLYLRPHVIRINR